jgi:hypothetical protein
MSNQVLITLDTLPASDGWGFVGQVCVDDVEVYRTVRAYASPDEALAATRSALGSALGEILAGQEWRIAAQEFGHAPHREELGFGLRRRVPEPRTGSPEIATGAVSSAPLDGHRP